MEDLSLCRKDFPIFERKVNGNQLAYFDSAATTQKPVQVIEKVREFYTKSNANVHRGVHTLSHEASLLYEEAHRKVAKFIGAKDWKEIIFTRNATEGLNLIAYSYGMKYLRQGDEIVLTIMEHHSNIVPWLFLSETKGVKLRYVDITEDGRLNLDQYESLLGERTKIVSVVHASNLLGTVNPVKEIVRKAKEVEAITIIDAAQSVPHIPVSVSEIGCDFLVGSGHKMLGPSGTGFLYGKKEILEKMEPFLYGGDMIREVTMEKATWNELPWKYEAGTPHIAGGIGLGVACEYLERVGIQKIEAHEKKLLNYALARLNEMDRVKLYGPEEGERVGIIAFNIEGVHPHDVAHFLDLRGICLRSGHHCAQPLLRRLGLDGVCRISFYLYNTEEEIDRLVESLRELMKIF